MTGTAKVCSALCKGQGLLEARPSLLPVVFAFLVSGYPGRVNWRQAKGWGLVLQRQ
jgi:hypothetical protein